MDHSEAAIGDGKTRPEPSWHPHLVNGNTQDLDIQIAVREDADNAHQVVEYIVKHATPGTVPRREVRTIDPGPPDDPPSQRDRLDDPDAVIGQQPSKFPA
jgi:hypothetical protein